MKNYSYIFCYLYNSLQKQDFPFWSEYKAFLTLVLIKALPLASIGGLLLIKSGGDSEDNLRIIVTTIAIAVFFFDYFIFLFADKWKILHKNYLKETYDSQKKIQLLWWIFLSVCVVVTSLSLHLIKLGASLH